MGAEGSGGRYTLTCREGPASAWSSAAGGDVVVGSGCMVKQVLLGRYQVTGERDDDVVAGGSVTLNVVHFIQQLTPYKDTFVKVPPMNAVNRSSSFSISSDQQRRCTYTSAKPHGP